ncbi:MAG: hypothetical protein IJB74_10165 [Clostridia bacterium]|nr:hypothetical protein [Clostridia bacterium]
MKKLIALFGAALILFSFVSCGKEKYLLTFGEHIVTNGLYNYYKSVAYAEKSENADETARQYCREYLAAIKLMEDEKITLGSEYKRLAAENTENIWGIFSEYYSSIGVTKQDITRMQTHESRKLQLLEHFYGSAGKDPVKEIDLKERFVDMYVGFKAIEGNLTRTNDKGETVPLTEKEIKETEKLFASMAKQINEGTATIDELNIQYNDSLGIIVTSPLSVLLTKNKDPMYDDGFFADVSNINHGKAGVIKSGDSVYVIERQTIATDDEDAFMNYRTEILKDMRMEKIEKKLKNLIGKMNITENF